MIERLAAYFGTRPRRVRVPAAVLQGAALLLALLRLQHPPLYADQMPRLLSPKPYEIDAAAAELGFKPRRLEEGLDVASQDTSSPQGVVHHGADADL